MDIIELVEQKYRSSKNYGITFSIDADAYHTEKDVEFGDNHSAMQCGVFYNWQPVLVDGKEVGHIEETRRGGLFDPTCVSFVVPLADCTEHELWESMESKYKDNPHLWDNDESLELRFATIQQMLEFLNKA